MMQRITCMMIRLLSWKIGEPFPRRYPPQRHLLQQRWYYTVGTDIDGLLRIRSTHRSFPSAERALRSDSEAIAVMYEPATTPPLRCGNGVPDTLRTWTVVTLGD